MSGRRRHVLVTIALLLIFGFAVDSMWLLLLRNSYMSTLAHIRDVGPRHLPGSDTPIRSRYSGIPLLDYWFAVMQTILANVTDGSAPRLSLYAFHFAGQLGSMTTLLIMESMRVGNKGTLVSWFMPWGLLMTAYGYAVIMPVYGIVHLFVSSTTSPSSENVQAKQEIQIPDHIGLYTLPAAIVLGYGMPVLLMALPIFTTDWHQLFVAGWHLFPIWVALSHFLLKLLASSVSIGPPLNSTPNQTMSSATEYDKTYRFTRKRSLRRSYRIAFRLSAATHVLTIIIIGLAQRFPSLFPSPQDQPISWSSVFLPDYWRSTTPMQDFVQGTLNLLQYDQYSGSLAALTWGVGVYWLSLPEKRDVMDWVFMAIEVTAISVCFGPAAALTILLSRRDQHLVNPFPELRRGRLTFV
ncbi:hypothetical protein AYL99_00948 [Fonsecaea erecta]|uniref:Uncharacterized protein n=1 Tax=Fonsecaea erecta TaxID=1367422 RepID=A0A179A042_9EURO|nr:hypothetical protein AYL99_00948 [Fonsecaea erecta]OAP64976.1 hypothetical protein AYL99_00948 [Fonsecaea erecta]